MTIEEIREALRRACAEARAGEPEGTQAAATAPASCALAEEAACQGQAATGIRGQVGI